MPHSTDTCLLCDKAASFRIPTSENGGKRKTLRVDCAECGTYQVAPNVDLEELRGLSLGVKALIGQRTRALLHRVPLLVDQAEIAVARKKSLNLRQPLP